MIKGVLDIGRQLVTGDAKSFLASLAQPARPAKDNREQYVCVLDFSSKGKPNVKVDPHPIGDDTTARFLWVGNAYGRSPQDRATTKEENLAYFLSQTVPNLIKGLPEGDLKRKLTSVRVLHFRDCPVGVVLDVNAEYLEDALQLVNAKRTKAKKPRAPVSADDLKDIEDVFRRFLGRVDSPKDIMLYSLAVDGRCLAEEPEYHDYLVKILVDDLFAGAPEGTCHGCERQGPLIWDTSGFQQASLLKLHITDKLGFASDLSRQPGFLRNYAVCKDCYRALLAGNAFIRRKLRSSLAYEAAFLVPSIHVESAIPVGRIDRWADYVREKFGAIRSFEGWKELRSKMQEYSDYEGTSGGYTLSFYVGKPSNAAFKVKRVIADVPPSHLDRIQEVQGKVRSVGNRLLGESRSWDLYLGTVAGLIPVPKVRKKKGTPKAMNQPVLALLSDIIGGQQVDAGRLIPWFAELARVYRLDRFDPQTTVRKPRDPKYAELEFSRAMLQCNLLVEYLRRLELLRYGGRMTGELDKLSVRQEVADFLREMKYDEPRAALFLLGTLVGGIGTEQFNAGAKSKPILNKLNFHAMGVPKLRRLYSDVFERMHQLKLLTAENEKTYAVSMEMFGKSSEQWPLTAEESVFYVVSGYAFSTYKAITSRKPELAQQAPEEVRNQSEGLDEQAEGN